MSPLLHPEQTYILRGLIFDTHNDLRPGWPEEIYHQALYERARQHNIPVQTKPQLSLTYRNFPVQTFECDLLFWDMIIVELKSLPFIRVFAPNHYAQIISYLKLWQKDLGLLVNFGPSQAKIARVVWTPPPLDTHRDMRHIESLTNFEKLALQACEGPIDTIAQHVGLGYLSSVYHTLLSLEYPAQGYQCLPEVDIPTPDKKSSHHAPSYLLVESAILIQINAILDAPTDYHFSEIKTYLRALGLKAGLIVNFGKKQLQIFGVPA